MKNYFESLSKAADRLENVVKKTISGTNTNRRITEKTFPAKCLTQIGSEWESRDFLCKYEQEKLRRLKHRKI